ncbi:hypothetical protein [Muriicola marianensis]|uniref:hypothetical protein n=1 Tax=Muriicola marianensis TaxID=1324801 RepID=UPI00166E44B4|nr:hypothetical protein [Muriicola marianensis]
MKKAALFLILLTAISCKSFRFDDGRIVYRYTDSNNYIPRILGDFDVVNLIENDTILISCGYFRDRVKSPRSLSVILWLNKKYAFETYGKVISKEFGPIPLSEENSGRESNNRKEYFHFLSLENMDMAERKSRILRDTISINFGNRSFKYAPRSRFD